MREAGPGGGDGLGGDHYGAHCRYLGGTLVAGEDGVLAEEELRGRPILSRLTEGTKPRPAGRSFRVLGLGVNRCPIAGEPTVVSVAKPRAGCSGN